MNDNKKRTSSASEKEKKRAASDTSRRSYTGSHAVRRRIRLDRIAVVVIPLLLIVILIGALCLHSCDRESGGNNGSSAATPVTTLQSQDSSVDDASSHVESSIESSESSNNIDEEMTQVTLTADAVGQGNLIVINAEHAYTFSEDDIELQSVYEQRNSSYSVSDMEVRLDAETLTQLNAMMAEFEAETGYSSLQVFSGYRTKEDQDTRYENGTSIFQGGYSDYHSGRTFNLRINFGDGTSDYYNAEKYPDYSWISEHAAEYGFVVRYPADKVSITGEEGRTYTFRYVGVPHAVYMTSHQLCLEEYIELIQRYTVDNPMEITVGDMIYTVFYVPLNGEENVDISIPSENYTISGDNIGGFVVTSSDSE